MAKDKKGLKGELNAYILLDRSGSMQPRWVEALSSINSYVEDLSKGGSLSAKVTLATFDGQDGLQFDVIRDGVAAKKWEKMTDADATPRGMTPLFDALGRTVAMAEKANADKTVIVVMTDGEENHSREVTKQGAKAALDRCKAKGWQVVFLGAVFRCLRRGSPGRCRRREHAEHGGRQLRCIDAGVGDPDDGLGGRCKP